MSATPQRFPFFLVIRFLFLGFFFAAAEKNETSSRPPAFTSTLTSRRLNSPNSEQCTVFDAFKVLPPNATNVVGGAFALHSADCVELIPESVQEIVALQWVFAHWNAAQKSASSQIGLYVGDSCSRPKESVLQTLKFLDSVEYYDPAECTPPKTVGSMMGILAPKDRESATALAGVLSPSSLFVAAYTPESAEALLDGGVSRLLITVPLIDDYVAAFAQLMNSLESDLVMVATCEKRSGRLARVLKALAAAELHVSEMIHTAHELFAEVVAETDAKVLLYLPCDDGKTAAVEPRRIGKGPKLLVTLGVGDSDAHFPHRIEGSQEVLIRSIPTDLPRFKPYLLKILASNYDTYALASSYIQQVMNCSFALKSCPPVDVESLGAAYEQGPHVDAIVRAAYAFAVAGRFVDVDAKLKEICVQAGASCTDAVLTQLTSMRFVQEKHGPLELANEELGFFPKAENVVQSIGLRLEAVMGGGADDGSEELFKYIISREPKLIGLRLPAAIRTLRSVCQPYHTYCGQCERPVSTEKDSVFVHAQQVLPLYVAGVFNLHAADCDTIRQESVLHALAFTHTLTSITEKYPNLALRPLKDYGLLIVDGCADPQRTRQFAVDSETQCMRVPLNEFNVSIPAGTIVAHVAALSDYSQQSEYESLLAGLRIPSVALSTAAAHSAHSPATGVFSLLASAQRTANAVASFLKSQQWDYVSVVVSAGDRRSLRLFEAFSSAVADFEICVGNVLFFAADNRTRANSAANTNITVFFTTADDAAEFVATRPRFTYAGAGGPDVDVMVDGANDFYLRDSANLQQYAGTVAIRPRDVVSNDFKAFLHTVTPLYLPEPWFWDFVERRWRCALSLNNQRRYEGRMCTGDELLNVPELGRMTDAGYLARGVERLVLAMDTAFRKTCGDAATQYCSEFLENGRRLLTEELSRSRSEVEFEVDEFAPLDHHGNFGYRRIGNFSTTLHYNEIEEYRVFVGGIPKPDVQYTSSCVAPYCVCKQGDADAHGNGLGHSDGRRGASKWFHASKSAPLMSLEDSTLNYVFLGVTSTIVCLSTLTMGLVLWKMYTRVIKGNQSLGILSLIGIQLFSVTAFICIFDAADQLVELRMLLNGLAHVLCIGVVLIKAIRLRNAEDLCGERKPQIGYWNYWIMIFFVVMAQVAIHLHRLDGLSLRDLYTEAYVAILLLLALGANVRNRAIRRNYKESKWLFIANIVALFVYGLWAVARLWMPDMLSSRQLDIIELNIMSLVLLGFLFGPKVYILLLYEPFVVERCATPAKPAFLDDDLFENGSAASSHTVAVDRRSQQGEGLQRNPSSNAHRSASTVSSSEEFPVLKTVMRRRDFNPTPSERRLRLSRSSDRHSNASIATS